VCVCWGGGVATLVYTGSTKPDDMEPNPFPPALCLSRARCDVFLFLQERVRPKTPELKRIEFALKRKRADHLQQIVDYHRAGFEEVDQFGRSRFELMHQCTAKSDA
jgi:hypothetical protein